VKLTPTANRERERENRNVLKSYHAGSKNLHLVYILLTKINFTKTNDKTTSSLAGFVLIDYDYLISV